jgi:hypothetical protein
MTRELDTYYDGKFEDWTKDPKVNKGDIQRAIDHIDAEADLPGGEIDRQNDAGRKLRSLLEKTK